MKKKNLFLVAVLLIVGTLAYISLPSKRNSPAAATENVTERREIPFPSHRVSKSREAARIITSKRNEEGRLPIKSELSPQRITKEHENKEPAEPIQNVPNKPEKTKLQENWASQRENPKWSKETRKYLTDMIEHSQIADVRLGEVECRTTLCRLEMGFSNITDAAAFKEISSRPDYQHRAYGKRKGDRLEVVIYIANENQKIAELIE